MRTTALFFLVATACDRAPAQAEAGSDAMPGDPLDAAVDGACDPIASYDAMAVDGSGSCFDGGVIDLDCGTTGLPGRFGCHVQVGADAFDDTCPKPLVCCVLKTECYDPSREQSFCLRPYCR